MIIKPKLSLISPNLSGVVDATDGAAVEEGEES